MKMKIRMIESKGSGGESWDGVLRSYTDEEPDRMPV